MNKLILFGLCMVLLASSVFGAIIVTRTDVLEPPYNVTANVCTQTGDLTNGQEYCYKVKVTDVSSFGHWSNSTDEVCVTADANGCINITWDYDGDKNYFMIWRTPDSGNYTFVGNDNANYDRDTDPMFLRDGKVYHNYRYTIANQHYYEDIGSISERPSGYTYYREWMNFEHIEGEQAELNVDTDTCEECADFEDIYNAYPDNFRRIYGRDTGHGYQIYETDDQIDIDGCFEDEDFTLLIRGVFNMNNVECEKQLGLENSGVTWGDWEIISIAPGGRQNNVPYSFTETNLYAGKLKRDRGNSDEYNKYTSTLSTLYQPSSATGIWENVNVIDFKRINNDQYTNLNSGNGVSIDRWDDYRNVRGFKANADQSANSFNDIRHFHNMFLSNNNDNQAVTIRGANPLHDGNEFRFYQNENATTTLIDPVADAPGITGLPTTATTNEGKNNYLYLQWSFDLNVQDVSGNGINNAEVSITDRFGNTWNNITDISGDIDTQTLQQSAYTHTVEVGDTQFDVTNSSNPYTIEIKKSGYLRKIFDYNITKTEEFVVTMRNATLDTLNFTGTANWIVD